MKRGPTQEPELRFPKSLAQERFKSNMEFKYQTIVSAIKSRKGFAKLMILVALFKMFLRLDGIANMMSCER